MMLLSSSKPVSLATGGRCWSAGRKQLSVPHLVAQVPQVVEGVALSHQLGGQDPKLATEEGGTGGVYRHSGNTSQPLVDLGVHLLVQDSSSRGVVEDPALNHRRQDVHPVGQVEVVHVVGQQGRGEWEQRVVEDAEVHREVLGSLVVGVQREPQVLELAHSA